MDGRFCDRKHEHSPIAGSFRTGAGSVQVSRFSAFYPVILARSIAKALMEEHDQPVVSWEKVCVGEEVAMEPVPELKQLLHMSEGEICLLEGNAYGRVDAPLLFYKEFRRHLEGVGFEAHPLDNCLYLLRNKQNPAVLDGNFGGTCG